MTRSEFEKRYKHNYFEDFQETRIMPLTCDSCDKKIQDAEKFYLIKHSLRNREVIRFCQECYDELKKECDED